MVFSTYSPRRMVTLTKDDAATKSRHDIRTKKITLTVMWNSLGFHVVDRLPTGARMNNDDFTGNILAPLEQQMLPAGKRPHAKRVTLHLDERSLHMSGAMEVYISEDHMILLKHPPYSPNLAPSAFYLFPTVKEKLKNIQMVDEADLFSWLQELLNGISHKELAQVFGTSINRLMIVSQSDEDGSHIN